MKKGKLIKYAFEADLMNVFIQYGEEEFSFNLFAETLIDENTINKEIHEQPSVYGSLGMLHKKLVRVAKDKEREMERIYSSMYIKFKEQIDENTGRPTANELAKEKANNSTKYQKAIKDYIEADHHAQVIGVCVKTFEGRENLLQTLSANIRKNS